MDVKQKILLLACDLFIKGGKEGEGGEGRRKGGWDHVVVVMTYKGLTLKSYYLLGTSSDPVPQSDTEGFGHLWIKPRKPTTSLLKLTQPQCPLPTPLTPLPPPKKEG